MLFVADGPLEWFCGNWLPWVSSASLCIALYNNSVNFSSYPGVKRDAIRASGSNDMADSDLFHSRYSHLVTLFFLCQLATNHKIKQLPKVDRVFILRNAISVFLKL